MKLLNLYVFLTFVVANGFVIKFEPHQHYPVISRDLPRSESYTDFLYWLALYKRKLQRFGFYPIANGEDMWRTGKSSNDQIFDGDGSSAENRDNADEFVDSAGGIINTNNLPAYAVFHENDKSLERDVDEEIIVENLEDIPEPDPSIEQIQFSILPSEDVQQNGEVYDFVSEDADRSAEESQEDHHTDPLNNLVALEEAGILPFVITRQQVDLAPDFTEDVEGSEEDDSGEKSLLEILERASRIGNAEIAEALVASKLNGVNSTGERENVEYTKKTSIDVMPENTPAEIFGKSEEIQTPFVVTEGNQQAEAEIVSKNTDQDFKSPEINGEFSVNLTKSSFDSTESTTLDSPLLSQIPIAPAEDDMAMEQSKAEDEHNGFSQTVTDKTEVSGFEDVKTPTSAGVRNHVPTTDAAKISEDAEADLDAGVINNNRMVTSNSTAGILNSAGLKSSQNVKVDLVDESTNEDTISETDLSKLDNEESKNLPSGHEDKHISVNHESFDIQQSNATGKTTIAEERNQQYSEEISKRPFFLVDSFGHNTKNATNLATQKTDNIDTLSITPQELMDFMINSDGKTDDDENNTVPAIPDPTHPLSESTEKSSSASRITTETTDSVLMSPEELFEFMDNTKDESNEEQDTAVQTFGRIENSQDPAVDNSEMTDVLSTDEAKTNSNDSTAKIENPDELNKSIESIQSTIQVLENLTDDALSLLIPAEEKMKLSENPEKSIQSTSVLAESTISPKTIETNTNSIVSSQIIPPYILPSADVKRTESTETEESDADKLIETIQKNIEDEVNRNWKETLAGADETDDILELDPKDDLAQSNIKLEVLDDVLSMTEDSTKSSSVKKRILNESKDLEGNQNVDKSVDLQQPERIETITTASEEPKREEDNWAIRGTEDRVVMSETAKNVLEDKINVSEAETDSLKADVENVANVAEIIPSSTERSEMFLADPAVADTLNEDGDENSEEELLAPIGEYLEKFNSPLRARGRKYNPFDLLNENEKAFDLFSPDDDDYSDEDETTHKPIRRLSDRSDIPIEDDDYPDIYEY